MHFLEANDKNQTFEKGLDSIDNLTLTHPKSSVRYAHTY